MADLIDRQAVQEMVDRIGDIHPYRQIGNRESYSQYNEAWTDAINRVDAELNSLPSTDAVEVVRCKDCVKCQVDTIFNQYWCGGERVLPNGFCNYGRRKDGCNQ